MTTLITDPELEDRLLAERRAMGGDRYDEVWDGVYIMSPLANNEHQELVFEVGMAIKSAFAGDTNVRVFPGVNVSDRADNWEHNYRCPDVAVVLPDSKAVDCGTFFLGGPDFVVEIASDYDRSREKFDFYSAVGVRELLLIDRDPWQIELYSLIGSVLTLIARGDVADGAAIASKVVPLSFQLVKGSKSSRPQIEIVKTNGSGRWIA